MVWPTIGRARVDDGILVAHALQVAAPIILGIQQQRQQGRVLLTDHGCEVQDRLAVGISLPYQVPKDFPLLVFWASSWPSGHYHLREESRWIWPC
jgi:hypothetical protein